MAEPGSSRPRYGEGSTSIQDLKDNPILQLDSSESGSAWARAWGLRYGLAESGDELKTVSVGMLHGLSEAKADELRGLRSTPQMEDEEKRLRNMYPDDEAFLGATILSDTDRLKDLADRASRDQNEMMHKAIQGFSPMHAVRGDKVHDLYAYIARLQYEHAQQLEQKEKERAEAQQSYHAAKDRESDARSELNKQALKVEELERENARLETTMQESERKAKSASGQLIAARKTAGKLREASGSTGEQIADLKTQVEALKAQVDLAKKMDQIGTGATGNQATSAEIQELRKEVDEMIQGLQFRESERNRKLAQQVADLEKEAAALKTKQKSSDETQTKLTELGLQNKNAQEEKGRLQARVNSLEGSVVFLETSLADSDDCLATAQDNRADATEKYLEEVQKSSKERFNTEITNIHLQVARQELGWEKSNVNYYNQLRRDAEAAQQTLAAQHVKAVTGVQHDIQRLSKEFRDISDGSRSSRDNLVIAVGNVTTEWRKDRADRDLSDEVGRLIDARLHTFQGEQNTQTERITTAAQQIGTLLQSLAASVNGIQTGLADRAAAVERSVTTARDAIIAEYRTQSAQQMQAINQASTSIQDHLQSNAKTVDLLRESYKREIDGKTAQVTELQERLENVQGREQQLSKDVKNITDELAKVRHSESLASAEVVKNNAEIARLQEIVANQKSRDTSIDQKLHQIQSTMENAPPTTSEALQNTLQNALEQLAGKVDRSSELEAKVETAEREKRLAEEQAAQQKTENENLQTKIDSFAKALQSERSEKTEIHEKFAQLQVEHDDLEIKVAEKDEQISNRNIDLQTTEEARENLQKQLDASKDELAERDRQISDIVREKAASKSDAEAQRQSAQKQFADQTKQWQEALARLDSDDAEVAQLRAQIQALSDFAAKNLEPQQVSTLRVLFEQQATEYTKKVLQEKADTDRKAASQLQEERERHEASERRLHELYRALCAKGLVMAKVANDGLRAGRHLPPASAFNPSIDTLNDDYIAKFDQLLPLLSTFFLQANNNSRLLAARRRYMDDDQTEDKLVISRLAKELKMASLQGMSYLSSAKGLAKTVQKWEGTHTELQKRYDQLRAFCEAVVADSEGATPAQ